MSLSRRHLLGHSLEVGKGGFLGALLGGLGHTETVYAEREDACLRVRPVGRVERDDEGPCLRIFGPYLDALAGLEAYSHVFVLFWFDRNDTPEKRRTLRVHPRGNKNNPLTGVFACRAPVRPNLIGLTLCKIQSVAKGMVRIDKIDALNGSPIVDIKPYIPTIDSTTENVQMPQWLSS